MFSKALFKQSFKANRMMWAIITFAECFMLACVMLISGRGGIDTTIEAVKNTIVQQEIDVEIEARAINYYETQLEGMKVFDELFAKNLQKQISLGNIQTADSVAYTDAMTELQEYLITKAQGINPAYTPESDEAQEIIGCVIYAINPPNPNDTTKGMFDWFYILHNETVPGAYFDRNEVLSHITDLSSYFSSEERLQFISNRSQDCAPIFLAGNMTSQANVDKMLAQLSKYDISPEEFASLGYTYSKVKQNSVNTITTYCARLEKELEKLDKTQEDYEQKVAQIKMALAGDISSSFLSSLPKDVSSAFEEIGQLNLYGIVVGSIFFRLAGLLLPIIYMIMVSNNLIAGQVDSGSMAYVLSSSTKRQTVVFTQATFLIASLFTMFALTSVTSCICLAIVGETVAELTYGQVLLFNLGAFLVLFALSGLCFFTSCWFDRSKRSMAIGGGLSIFALVAAMLGLFGSKVIPTIVRLKALNNFNYATVITFFDAISIIDGTLTFLWKFAILLVLGIIGYVVGSIHFVKKDLPL